MNVRLKGTALAVASLFIAALFTWSAAFCNRHSADSLLPTLISTQKLTWYFWGQNRLGSLLPFLTSPISDVDINLRTQVFLRALCAVLGPMFFVLVARPHAPVLVVYAGVLMALLLAATPNLNFLFSYAVDGQPYGTSLAVMVAAVMIANHTTWKLRWTAVGAGAAVLAILCVALWVNLSAVLLTVPLFAALALLRRSWRDAVLLALTLAAYGLMSWHASWVGGPQYVVLLPSIENVAKAAMLLSSEISPIKIALLGTAAILAGYHFRRQPQRMLTPAALLAAALGAFLITANIEWVVLSLSFPRYFILPVTAAIAALAILAIEALWDCGQALLPTLVSWVSAAVLGPVATASIIMLPLSPSCRFDGLSASSDEIAAIALRTHATFIAGEYWTTWPAVFRTISRSGHQVYGLTRRAEGARAPLRQAVMRNPGPIILCVDEPMAECLDRLVIALGTALTRKARIIDAGHVETEGCGMIKPPSENACGFPDFEWRNRPWSAAVLE